MFFVIHYIPTGRTYEKVNAAISNFEIDEDNEDFARMIFDSTYIGQNIIFISMFSSVQLAKKHVNDNGHYIEKAETFFLPISLRSESVLEPVLPLYEK